MTLTFVGLLLPLLAGLGAFQYVSLERNLNNVRAASLRGDFEEGVLSLRQTLPAATPAPGGVASPSPSPSRGIPTPGPQTPADVIRSSLCLPGATADARARLAAAAQELARRISIAAGAQVGVLILDRRLHPVGHTPATVAVDSIPRLSSAPFEEALAGRTPAAEVIQTPNGPQLVAAFGIPTRTGGAVCGIAQLSTSTDQGDQVLSSFRTGLILSAAVVAALALLIGLLLTGRALAPMRRLTETARTLASGDLRARSRIPPRGDEVGVLAHTFDDMAERIESAFAVQAESEARMRRFIADASHELRTPVTALKGYIDVLRRGAGRDPAALDAALESMAAESERMRVLVLDLLTLARVDAQRLQAPEQLELASVVFSVLGQGIPGMPDSLTREPPDRAVNVLAERGSVETMVRNLLVNACKYAPGAAQIWRVSRDGDCGIFSVRDEGPGIAAGDLPHVFERFYRGEKTRAREEGGSGLGLSIVQGLAVAMGGAVEIASVEGGGTTVTVRLPLAPRLGSV